MSSEHHDNATQEPGPVGLAKKLFLYTVAGAIAYGLAVLILVR